MEAKRQEPIEVLRVQAKRLNAISQPASFATAFFEVMSGALVWSDEKLEDGPTELVWALRPLFAFRSSLILGSPQEKWRPYWDECAAMFPQWIGFRSERSTATPELLRALRVGARNLDRCLKGSPK